MNFKNIIRVSGFTFLSRVLGLFRDVILSRYLGAGALSDAFFIAFKIPNLFRRFFAEGSMQAAFVPIFSSLLAKDEKAAKEFASQVFTVFFLILILFVIFMEIFAPYVIMGISPGLKNKGDDLFNLTVLLLRIILPYLLFISMASFYSSVLNSLNKFSLVAFLPALLNFSMISVMLMGGFMDNLFPNMSYAASFGVFFGGIFQLVVVAWGCYRYKWFVAFVYVKNLSSSTKSFFKRILPVVFGAGVYQINIVIDVIVASLLPSGSISYLFYADRIYQLPLAIIGIAIGTVVLPSISNSLNSSKEKDKVKENALILALGFSLPASIALLILSEEIIKVIFFGGSFDYSAVQITAIILMIYALSLPANVLTKVILPFFYSVGDTKTPFYSTIACLFANLGLVFYLASIMGVYGIALATVIASYINFVILIFFLRKKHKLFLSNYFYAEIKKLLTAGVGLIVTLLVFKYLIFKVLLNVDLVWFRFIFVSFIFAMIAVVIFALKLLKSYIYDEIIRSFRSKVRETNKDRSD